MSLRHLAARFRDLSNICNDARYNNQGADLRWLVTVLESIKNDIKAEMNEEGQS